MAAPISFGDREIALTVSIGVALFDPDAAHQRRRPARRRGNRPRQRQEDRRRPRRDLRAGMRAERSNRLSLADDLRHALDRGEITVLFQPIVRLEDRTVAGFEALPRWRHPRLGLLGPDDFFSLAESNDVLVDIGVFAIETTARELAAWQKALEVTPPIFASINVSSRQMLGHDLLERRANRAQPPLRPARHAEARSHREPGDGKPGIRRPVAAARARTGRRPGARRFRRRATPRSAISSATVSTRSRSIPRSSGRTARAGARRSCVRSSRWRTTSAWT